MSERVEESVRLFTGPSWSVSKLHRTRWRALTVTKGKQRVVLLWPQTGFVLLVVLGSTTASRLPTACEIFSACRSSP